MPNQNITAKNLKGKTGITRLINATRYSRDGIKAAWKSEEAFREEAIIALILIPVAVFLPVEITLKLWCVFSVLFLMVVEVLNTAIEACIDRIGPQIHEKSKLAKDLGSAAVLFSIVFVVIVWGLTLFELAKNSF